MHGSFINTENESRNIPYILGGPPGAAASQLGGIVCNNNKQINITAVS